MALIVWCITLVYGLPATTTLDSISSGATSASLPRQNLEKHASNPEPTSAELSDHESTSPTVTIPTGGEIVVRQQSIPPYTPIVTPAPDQDAKLSSLRYYQVTYYTCNTIGGKESCGWHIPVMEAGAAKIGERTEVVLGVIIGLVIFWILL